MERITSILDRREPHFHTVSPESSVTDALQQMRCENVDYLVVVNDDERFLGILSDHDIATKLIFGKKPLQKTSVREIMNTRLPVATTITSMSSRLSTCLSGTRWRRGSAISLRI